LERTEFQTSDAVASFLHNRPIAESATLLFLHGLGDSSDAFREVQTDSRFDIYSLILPDMPGYGQSAVANETGIGFDQYTRLLRALLAQSKCRDLVIIGHSMGGVIGTLLSRLILNWRNESLPETTIQLCGLVNIEGNLLADDQFLSCGAVEQADRGEVHFSRWFKKFQSSLAPRPGQKQPISMARYSESLALCQYKAFLANSYELVSRSGDPDPTKISEVAEQYLSLPVPKFYCLGANSHAPATLAFLDQHHENRKIYANSGHSLMIDKAEEFYGDLLSFIQTALAR